MITNQEAIRLIRNLPTMCEFTDAYGEPIDSDAYYEAIELAISALQSQDLQPTCNNLATDTVSRKAAINALCRRCDLAAEDDEPCTEKCNDIKVLEKLSSAQPEIIRCKDCKWFNDTGCAICIVDEADKPSENDYCSFAERRADEQNR